MGKHNKARRHNRADKSPSLRQRHGPRRWAAPWPTRQQRRRQRLGLEAGQQGGRGCGRSRRDAVDAVRKTVTGCGWLIPTAAQDGLRSAPAVRALAASQVEQLRGRRWSARRPSGKHG